MVSAALGLDSALPLAAFFAPCNMSWLKISSTCVFPVAGLPAEQGARAAPFSPSWSLSGSVSLSGDQQHLPGSPSAALQQQHGAWSPELSASPQLPVGKALPYATPIATLEPEAADEELKGGEIAAAEEDEEEGSLPATPVDFKTPKRLEADGERQEPAGMHRLR